MLNYSKLFAISLTILFSLGVWVFIYVFGLPEEQKIIEDVKIIVSKDLARMYPKLEDSLQTKQIEVVGRKQSIKKTSKSKIYISLHSHSQMKLENNKLKISFTTEDVRLPLGLRCDKIFDNNEVISLKEEDLSQAFFNFEPPKIFLKSKIPYLLHPCKGTIYKRAETLNKGEGVKLALQYIVKLDANKHQELALVQKDNNFLCDNKGKTLIVGVSNKIVKKIIIIKINDLQKSCLEQGYDYLYNEEVLAKVLIEGPENFVNKITEDYFNYTMELKLLVDDKMFEVLPVFTIKETLARNLNLKISAESICFGIDENKNLILKRRE